MKNWRKIHALTRADKSKKRPLPAFFGGKYRLSVFGNTVDIGGNIVFDGDFFSFRPFDGVVGARGDHLRKLTLRTAPIVVAGIVGSGIQNERQHFGGIGIAAIFVSIYINEGFSHGMAGMIAEDLKEFADRFRIDHGHGNVIGENVVIDVMRVPLLQGAVERIREYADADVGISDPLENVDHL